MTHDTHSGLGSWRTSTSARMPSTSACFACRIENWYIVPLAWCSCFYWLALAWPACPCQRSAHVPLRLAAAGCTMIQRKCTAVCTSTELQPLVRMLTGPRSRCFHSTLTAHLYCHAALQVIEGCVRAHVWPPPDSHSGPLRPAGGQRHCGHRVDVQRRAMRGPGQGALIALAFSKWCCTAHNSAPCC